MSVASVGRVQGSVVRLTGITPEDVFSGAEICVTVGLEERITSHERERLLAGGLDASQIDKLDAALHSSRNAPGQHETRCSRTKKGKSAGLYCEFYSDLELQLYHGWEGTTVALKVRCLIEKEGKRATRLLGTFAVPVPSILEQGCSGFFDVIPTQGSKLETARIKLTLSVETAASVHEPERTFDVQAASIMGGPRQIILANKHVRICKPSGAVECKFNFANVKKVSCKAAEIRLFATPGHLQKPVRYLAVDAEGAVGISARIHAEIHAFAVNIAAPGLVELMKDQQAEETEKLAMSRASLRTSSSDSKHALAHQTSLTAQTEQITTCDNGDAAASCLNCRSSARYWSARASASFNLNSSTVDRCCKASCSLRFSSAVSKADCLALIL